MPQTLTFQKNRTGQLKPRANSKPFAGQIEITPDQAKHATIEIRAGKLAGEYGFRVRTLADETADVRLIHAAVRFADDYALGVSGVRGERMGLGSDNRASPGGYTQTQLDALQRLREAQQAVGMIANGILYLIIIECVTARELGRRINQDHKGAQRHAKKALTALADWYDDPKPRRKKNAPKN